MEQNKNRISASVIADSKNQFGNRITTMVVTMPRFILAEFNTHRMFSRNSASSRAIPFEKMVKSVQENPFIPIAWQKDHKGMQGTEYLLDQDDIERAKKDWLNARDYAVEQAVYLSSHHGVTKQLCNRLLEPFMWHTVICTFTEIENFFALRCPRYEIELVGADPVNNMPMRIFRSKKDFQSLNHDSNLDYATDLQWLQLNKGQAEIHMMALAEAMWDEVNLSVPKLLKSGEYHVPFIEIEEDI